MSLSILDWVIVAIYLVVIATLGLVLARKTQSSEAYFLAGRSLRWPFIGTSMFAAGISAEHFVGLAGSGYGAIGGAVPTSYVIDRAGVVRQINLGAFDDESFDSAITPLLAEPGPAAP